MKIHLFPSLPIFFPKNDNNIHFYLFNTHVHVGKGSRSPTFLVSCLAEEKQGLNSPLVGELG